jgi:quercetin dioxygenase-like cupin family protein
MEVRARKPTAKGPAGWFTGDVWIDAMGHGQRLSAITIGSVHFTPGARTAWDSHAVGQTLFVTEGEGRVQGLSPQ